MHGSTLEIDLNARHGISVIELQASEPSDYSATLKVSEAPDREYSSSLEADYDGGARWAHAFSDSANLEIIVNNWPVKSCVELRVTGPCDP